MAENDGRSGPATIELRGTVLPLERIVAGLLDHGGRAALERVIGQPALSDQELALVLHEAMQDDAAKRLLAEAGWRSIRHPSLPRQEQRPADRNADIVVYLTLSFLIVLGFIVIGN